MSPKMTSVIKSYARGVLVAVTPLLVIGSTEPKAYLAAIGAGVISPALRAMDKNDPAFGKIADAADIEIDKLVKADTKKKAIKKSA
jgi:hypothetical protein